MQNPSKIFIQIICIEIANDYRVKIMAERDKTGGVHKFTIKLKLFCWKTNEFVRNYLVCLEVIEHRNDSMRAK